MAGRSSHDGGSRRLPGTKPTGTPRRPTCPKDGKILIPTTGNRYHCRTCGQTFNIGENR
jgi:hypothetical protein